MTVPYNHEWKETLVRVKTDGDRDIFVLPPEYHGGGGQTLAYRTYGRDLLDRLHGYGFSVGYLDLEVPKHGITRQALFIGRKGNYIDISKFHVVQADKRTNGVKLVPLTLFRWYVIVKCNAFSVRRYWRELVQKIANSIGTSHKKGEQ